MASTTFVNYQTVIDAGWLNDVNSAVYSGTFQASTITPTNVTSSGAISGATVAGTTSVTTPIVKSGTSLTLQTNGSTTAVTIDTAQNVGIGVTPSTWNSSIKVIEMSNGRNGALFADSGYYGAFGLSENAVWTPSSTNWTYKTTNASVRYDQNGVAGAGTHAWFIAPSGTAGATISWTQAMTLDNSGNLGIGTGTNYAAVNLYVGTATNGGTSQGGFSFAGGGTATFDTGHASGTASGATYQRYIYNGSVIGSITQNSTTGVLFNITSDRRLKTNIEPLANSGAIIDALLPRKFTWTSNNKEDLGFVTDEYQTVFPDAITGEPNATKEEEYEVTPAVKDEQGNITTPAVMGTRIVPVYQMGDFSTSAQIAVLVAEVQSLRARLKAANIA